MGEDGRTQTSLVFEARESRIQRTRDVVFAHILQPNLSFVCLYIRNNKQHNGGLQLI